jgi:hypothetical protein
LENNLKKKNNLVESTSLPVSPYQQIISQPMSQQQQQQHHHQHQQNIVTKHVTAPIDKPASNNNPLPPGQNICADCERLIV